MERILISESPKHIDEKIKVSGWINNYRTHGKLIFVDLRDRTGILQVTFLSELPKEILELAGKLRNEWVVEIEGKVNKRPGGTKNPNLATGGVELVAENLKVLSEAETLPFSIQDKGYEINEEKRLRYRYLDLRRERLKKNIVSRQNVIHSIREFLRNNSFIEIETPVLTKSTPEGARDFVVPSRLEKGKFYALPQSPQQYKQLLMVSGFEKYYQIAKCFRDEDPRADRQAEFTQVDIEASFVEQEEILDLTEKLIIEIVKKNFPEKRISKIPFPRIKYEEAIKKHNTDKPDLRKNKDNSEELSFAFIIDFPMFEWSKTDKRYKAVHHPFTRPKTEDIELIKSKSEKVIAHQYDLVLNGHEIAGGSLRSYRKEVLEAVFEVLGHKKKEIEEKFGHLLKAFEYGVPPHGGIAIGFDRLLSVFLNEKNIREVIPFPKTGESADLMMNTPSEISKEQLKELGLNIKKKK